LVEEVKQGVHLATAAASLMRGGFKMSKIHDAKELLATGNHFLQGLKHHNDHEGLGKEHFVEGWEEAKDVWMFSGE
jgi:hypothetical protein